MQYDKTNSFLSMVLNLTKGGPPALAKMKINEQEYFDQNTIVNHSTNRDRESNLNYLDEITAKLTKNVEHEEGGCFENQIDPE